jgi:hypothetical protein
VVWNGAGFASHEEGTMPNDGDEFTKEQAEEIGEDNWNEVAAQYGENPEWEISNNWHSELFEPRAMDWGYEDGKPIYAGIKIGGDKYHVYWIKNGDYFWLDPNRPR